MKLDPSTTVEHVREQLARSAHEVYGGERAQELSGQIDHLARMMSGIARQELDLTENPLPGREDRSKR